MSVNACCRDARDHHVGVGVDQVLHHHHRVVALLERLAVEEACELRQRLGVVVHGDRHVLLVGGELVPDLLVELADEGVGGHTCMLRRSRELASARKPHTLFPLRGA
jgi:hypothetical protein